ncbi:MAG: DsrE family protein [Chloroflexi bacterium]|nr:DsrE family protein [Chloroflexota bacterium]
MSVDDSRTSYIVIVNNGGMGHADPELRHKLLNTYLHMLLDNEQLPTAICFYAEGVKMVVEGSPVLEPLKRLSEKGVYLIVCSTCLGYFNLRDKVQVGIVGGMHDILEAQMRAGKVITL